MRINKNIYLKLSFTIITLLSLSIKSNAQNTFTIEGVSGVEFNRMDWSVSGDSKGQNPNILSELKWRDLVGINYNLSLNKDLQKATYFLNLSFSPKLNGTVEDTDYTGDDRSNPSYYQLFKSTNSRNFMGRTGIKIKLKKNFISGLDLSTGLRYRNQRLFLEHKNESIRSYYNSNWIGLFAGIITSAKISNSIIISLYAETNMSYYQGFGGWGLRMDLAQPKSFIHKATAYDIYTDLKTTVHLNKTVSLTTAVSASSGDTFKGTDILYFKDNRSASTQLNGVKSTIIFVRLGAKIVL